MAISFIPNQPIIFTDPLFAGQSCLNNDTRAYAQLAQADDSTCIQFINEPVGALYDCIINEVPDIILNGSLTSDLSNWDEYDFATGTNLGAPTNWISTPEGAKSDPSTTQLGLIQDVPGSVGNIYMISLEYDYLADGNFYIWIGSQATNSWNGINLLTNYTKNFDGRRCIILSSLGGLTVAIQTDTATVTVKNIIVRDITYNQCVIPNSNLLHWTYVESLDGWQKIDGTAATAFPLTILQSMTNGDSYKLSYKVTNLKEDGIAYFEIQDNGNNTLSKTYTNGEFIEYFTYTGPTGQPFILGNPESLTGVIYDIKIEEMCYDQRISITYPDGSPASIWYDSASSSNPLQFYKDRIVWCFDWSTLESFDVPGAPLSSDCYTVTIDDSSCGGSATMSYTIINYKATGSHECSVVVRASCIGNGFGFYFNEPGINVYFNLSQRLRLLQFNPTYPTKTEQYTYSSGTMNRTYAESMKVRTAWFDYVDEPTHDVIRLQLLCDTLIIDNKPFFCIAEDYEPEWGQNGKYNLAQSKVVLMAQNEPKLFNKNCI